MSNNKICILYIIYICWTGFKLCHFNNELKAKNNYKSFVQYFTPVFPNQWSADLLYVVYNVQDLLSFSSSKVLSMLINKKTKILKSTY